MICRVVILANEGGNVFVEYLLFRGGIDGVVQFEGGLVIVVIATNQGNWSDGGRMRYVAVAYRLVSRLANCHRHWTGSRRPWR